MCGFIQVFMIIPTKFQVQMSNTTEVTPDLRYMIINNQNMFTKTKKHLFKIQLVCLFTCLWPLVNTLGEQTPDCVAVLAATGDSVLTAIAGGEYL